MKQAAPPSWLESLLKFMLPARDRETVSGDLYEEFHKQKVAQLGIVRARFWYLRQVLSFVPRSVRSALARGPALTMLCVFTAMSGSWLGMMDLRLRHPGYGGREVIAGTIVCQALLTLAAVRFRRHPILRPFARVGSAAILWLAGKAMMGTLRGAHFEGYVLLIALALILQAMLTLFAMPTTLDTPEQSA